MTTKKLKKAARKPASKDAARMELLIGQYATILQRQLSLQHVIACILGNDLWKHSEQAETFVEMIRRTSKDTEWHAPVCEMLKAAEGFARTLREIGGSGTLQ